MQIMTQDGRRLVNGDYVSQIYIEQRGSDIALMAASDADILLGTYDNTEHAEKVLRFIGTCMVDEDTQGKLTQVPTREDMKKADALLSKRLNSDCTRERFERAVCKKGGDQNSDDSWPDLFFLLKGIFE